MSKKSYTRLLISTFITGLTFSTAIQAAPYDLIDLGALGDGDAFSFAINNLNEVTGTSEGTIVLEDDIDPDNPPDLCADNINRVFCTHAFLFTNSAMVDLGDLGLSNSHGLGINDDSVVVGFGIVPTINADNEIIATQETALISFSGAQVVAIPFPLDLDLAANTQPRQRALDISNNRLVVGYTLFRKFDDEGASNTLIQPYVYDYDNDSLSIIPLFSNEIARSGSARAINSSGVVVGWASSEEVNNPPHALRWDPASPELSVDLGTFGGFTSAAWAINDNGIIVGTSDTSIEFNTNESIAFIYDASLATPLIRIPEFSEQEEFKFSVARDINNNNQVVGTAQFSTAATNGNTAFMYDYNTGSLINLNDMVDCSLNWELYNATGINDAGYITGTGVFEGKSRSFMLIPTADTTPTDCTEIRRAARDQVRRDINDGAGSIGFLSLLLGSLVLWRRKKVN